MTNKEKQIIKELRKIAKYGILTDADGDFTEFYFKDIEELFSKALKSQREEIANKVENNCSEYDGKWHMRDKNGNCKKFIMADLRNLITKEDE